MMEFGKGFGNKLIVDKTNETIEEFKQILEKENGCCPNPDCRIGEVFADMSDAELAGAIKLAIRIRGALLSSHSEEYRAVETLIFHMLPKSLLVEAESIEWAEELM